MQQTPRADNSKADELANHAIDCGSFHKCHFSNWQKFLKQLAELPDLNLGLDDEDFQSVLSYEGYQLK